jgi:phospholipid-translocating ATPase
LEKQRLGIYFEGDKLSKSKRRIIRKVTYENKDRNEDKIEKYYELLHVLDFDSVRKRMSVIVRDHQTNQYILYCKGADVAILDRTVCNTNHLYIDCLKSFSERGWRTLMLSYRVLNDEQFVYFDNLLEDAKNDILNREARLADIYDQVERNLYLIGVTAVEDKLQENVQDTLFALREAGIKIWVLTGDKLETAINISESCKHFSANMSKLVMANMNDPEEIKNHFNDFKDR